MTTPEDSAAHGQTDFDPDDVTGLMAQLPAQGGRVGVWSIDPKAGTGYIGTVEVPGGEDAEWLLEYLRAEYGPGRYQLRPKSANGRWARGQCVVKLAQLPGEVPRVHNPGPAGQFTAAQPFTLTPDVVRWLQGVTKGQDGQRNPALEAVLVQALMNREGNESNLTRELISAALNRASPMGNITEALELIDRIRDNAPAAAAAPAQGGDDQQMPWMLMQMLMSQGQMNPMAAMMMGQAMGMPMGGMPMGGMPMGGMPGPGMWGMQPGPWGWPMQGNPFGPQPQQPQPQQPQQAPPQQPPRAPPQQAQPQQPRPDAEEWAAFQAWKSRDPQEWADFQEWRNAPLEGEIVDGIDDPPSAPANLPTVPNMNEMFQAAQSGNVGGLMAVLHTMNPPKANDG